MVNLIVSYVVYYGSQCLWLQEHNKNCKFHRHLSRFNIIFKKRFLRIPRTVFSIYTFIIKIISLTFQDLVYLLLIKHFPKSVPSYLVYATYSVHKNVCYLISFKLMDFFSKHKIETVLVV